VNSDDDPEVFTPVHWSNGIEDTLYVYAWDDEGSALNGWPPERIFVPGNFRGLPSSPALANLDGTGDWEVLSGLADSMYAWDDAGSDVSGWPVHTTKLISSSPAVGDFYPDSAGYEVIAGCGDLVYAWEKDGDVIRTDLEWWPQITDGSVNSSPALANIDSSASSPDTLLEVIVGSDGGYVYAWKLNGYDLTNFPFPTRAAVSSSPAIADVDGDGHLELVVGCQDGCVFLWSLAGSDCSSYAAPWPMFKHDRTRTAWFEYTP
jgi:hypothetical protein